MTVLAGRLCLQPASNTYEWLLSWPLSVYGSDTSLAISQLLYGDVITATEELLDVQCLVLRQRPVGQPCDYPARTVGEGGCGCRKSK